MSQNHSTVDTLSFSVLTGALVGLDVEMLFVPVFEFELFSDEFLVLFKYVPNPNNKTAK